MPPHRIRIYYGAVVNPLSTSSFDALPNAVLAVHPSGTIDWVERDVPGPLLQAVLARHGLVDSDLDLVALSPGEFLVPGFVDTHTHAPQVPNLGTGQQYELLDWLDNVTFPREAKFADLDFARSSYRSVVQRFVSCGTTTCCYYGTLHADATMVLADVVHAAGQRALIGKCNMDRSCPDYYVEPSVESSVSGTHALISHIAALDSPLVRPVLTPRFAISSTPELLTALGHLAAAAPDLPIQTHISENKTEVAYTKELFPHCANYADVYDAYGLLRSNTILAHAVHLEDAEVELIRARDAGISHCPTSNFNLRSGMAHVGKWLDQGIKVGLGTDVSGGFSPSILTAIQHASICSKMVAVQAGQSTDGVVNDPVSSHGLINKQLPVATLLHMATLGGAQVASLGSTVGSFEPGKAFDALLVSVRADLPLQDAVPGIWNDRGEGAGAVPVDEEALRESLGRFLFCGDDRNIREVYVQGHMIGGRNFSG